MTGLDKSSPRIEAMFDSLAKRYDLMNDIMTFYSHRKTREFMRMLVNAKTSKNVLDLATGTGDNIIYLKKQLPTAKYTGIDLSSKMLRIAFQKLSNKNLLEKVKLKKGNIYSIPYKDASFDLCCISYGIRNISNIEKGFEEIYRVTKPGGVFLIVEATNPSNNLFKTINNYYFSLIVPQIARIFSSDAEAYNYLAQSIKSFPSAKLIQKKLQKTNWNHIEYFSLIFGSVTVFRAQKTYE